MNEPVFGNVGNYQTGFAKPINEGIYQTAQPINEGIYQTAQPIYGAKPMNEPVFGNVGNYQTGFAKSPVAFNSTMK
jgi:hypothetical protein